MTDQNTQDPQDMINTIIQNSKDRNAELDEMHSAIKSKISSLDKEVSELSADIDKTTKELDQKEIEAGDELDQLLIEEAENQAAEDEEDATETED